MTIIIVLANIRFYGIKIRLFFILLWYTVQSNNAKESFESSVIGDLKPGDLTRKTKCLCSIIHGT